ncbi:MAG: hypothetical protein GY737_16295 [Desulfobacteraceae bacterium]|nr:hypothetical protein [Desulfobacteraceae bacterium]
MTSGNVFPFSVIVAQENLKLCLVFWASPTMRSKGDDIAEILYLMGVKPVWQKGSGNVRGCVINPSTVLR